MTVRLHQVRSGYVGFRLQSISLDWAASGLTALIGPNGCGKSTLLKTIAGHLDPNGGSVEISGQGIGRLGNRRLAKLVSFLPQHPVMPPAITVRDLVGYGRAPHQNLFGFRSAEDEERVEGAMSLVDLTALSDRPLASLSGGQRQRAFIAMCMAQDTPYLMFDEPTSFLDIRYQLDVLDLLTVLKATGKVVVVVLHDIEQAARYADEIIVMKAGGIVDRGPPGQVVTEAMIADVFGIAAEVFPDPNTGTPLISPIPSAPAPAVAS